MQENLNEIFNTKPASSEASQSITTTTKPKKKPRTLEVTLELHENGEALAVDVTEVAPEYHKPDDGIDPNELAGDYAAYGRELDMLKEENERLGKAISARAAEIRDLLKTDK